MYFYFTVVMIFLRNVSECFQIDLHAQMSLFPLFSLICSVLPSSSPVCLSEAFKFEHLARRYSTNSEPPRHFPPGPILTSIHYSTYHNWRTPCNVLLRCKYTISSPSELLLIFKQKGQINFLHLWTFLNLEELIHPGNIYRIQSCRTKVFFKSQNLAELEFVMYWQVNAYRS